LATFRRCLQHSDDLVSAQYQGTARIAVFLKSSPWVSPVHPLIAKLRRSDYLKPDRFISAIEQTSIFLPRLSDFRETPLS